ncbi:bifunctional DNA-formamidopyrimidine glycosylase/DNA-(apurinic or apyrimidinic site) lyase [Jiella endophytica]|uniref:Formamidopyrimidine-DNA glycosylase n=1 Tax=Jiella endophytica TaxID=2558362 RepID=A0A4Y8RCR0_9HYPH|nr:bifunctional DNA-formamidopyrimidine glycosylase/DNA-(apurinic or apyrimidinic site) lyase [Jiella endophytica]TFF19805.1 bifunctional DNA-formamidopyrimidine glycosylase/DNA-(apurinic or apyrimidinic site) lyase [Jiella endophytica]
MPELPEVETVRRGLEPVMAGALIERVVAARPDLRFPLPENFAARLAGRRIEGLGRRAKYLLADIEGGTVLAMHLGMSGSFRIESDAGESLPGVFVHPRSSERLHDHVRFELVAADGAPARVIFNDPRRFGYMSLIERGEFASHPHFRNLGIEPTGNVLSGEALAPHFAGRAAPLKAVLLDQSLIAGLGNIYVCEALWRARLSPRRAAGTLVTRKGLATKRLDELAIHIRETIADAIAAGGSSLRDYRQADGSLGYFQHSFAVYDREDEPCRRPTCRGMVKRIVQSGRSTFFCPVCQR